MVYTAHVSRRIQSFLCRIYATGLLFIYFIHCTVISSHESYSNMYLHDMPVNKQWIFKCTYHYYQYRFSIVQLVIDIK